MIETLLTAAAVAARIIANPFGNVFQKQLTANGNHPLLVNLTTYLILSIACLALVVRITWSTLNDDFWIYAILGGIAGAVGNGFLVKALQQGELSVLGPINSYKSVVGMLMGVLLLGEIPNAWGLLGVAIIIYGSYYIFDATEDKFTFRLFRKTEIQYRVWAMILTAVEAVFIKKVILASTPTAAFISWCFFGALFSWLLMKVYRVKLPNPFQGAASNLQKYLLLGLCIGTMQFTTNYVFKQLEVGYALSLFQLSTIVSVILGYKIFNEQEVYKKLIGAAIMIAGSIVIILFKDR
ncbi:EamA family transporter [Segetibacter sp. 3557_3]|uniref:EamA family transporter n=1 Tax=Segetibacter sp. 3557_3 TaxID=2547429 RepID=UPI001058CA86|nr:EamA family transporter [Segetibacter sp. 3557_3]TDH27011.1 EamA family transporter [Segetibacter sp. 3557_3]